MFLQIELWKGRSILKPLKNSHQNEGSAYLQGIEYNVTARRFSVPFVSGFPN